MNKSIPVRSEDVVARHIAGETIIVPIKSTAGELDDIFTLNEVASRTWDLIDGSRSIAAIATVIASEYEVTTDRSLDDTIRLLAAFAAAKIVMINQPASAG